MQVFQIKLKYHCSKPIKLQKFLMQQYKIIYFFNRLLSWLLFRAPKLFNVWTICENSFLTPLFPAEAYNPEASKLPLSVQNHARVFQPTQPSNQKYGKLFCPNMESENSSFELATLVHVCLPAQSVGVLSCPVVRVKSGKERARERSANIGKIPLILAEFCPWSHFTSFYSSILEKLLADSTNVSVEVSANSGKF